MWPFGRWGAREDLDERVARYARRELPRLLGLPPDRRGEPVVGAFERGTSSHLRWVALEGYGKVVLRVFFRKRQARRLAGYQRLHGLLSARAVPVPRLLFVDDSPATFRAFGLGVACEEFLDGRVVAELGAAEQAAALLSAATVLARLHGIRAPAAGAPWGAEAKWSDGWLRRRLAGALGALGARAIGPDRRRRRALAAWFPRAFRSLGRTAFPLVHGDPNGGNLLAAGDGGLRLLDLAWMGHWFPQLDLVVLEHWLERCAPGRRGELVDGYFRACGDAPPLSREAYEASRARFLAWVYLRMAGRRARRAARGRRRNSEGWERWEREAGELWDATEEWLRRAGGP